MPFYEYECANCKFYTEIMQKVSDAPLRKCPSCGKNTLKKLLSAPVFRLKGAGWYETDFKSDKEGRRNLAEKEKEPAPEKKEVAKDAADATPADKAEPKTETKPAAETKSADKGPGEGGATRRSGQRTRSTSRSAPKSRAKSRSAPRKHR
jgi:putative FmdB family regulatory protein